MKLQYVILLEILRIMVSVSQIIEAKITFKTVQEAQEVRKTLTKNNDGSLILRYEMKALGEGITNLVPESKMDKVSVVICEFEKLEYGRLKMAERGFLSVYVIVCIRLE